MKEEGVDPKVCKRVKGKQHLKKIKGSHKKLFSVFMK